MLGIVNRLTFEWHFVLRCSEGRRNGKMYLSRAKQVPDFTKPAGLIGPYNFVLSDIACFQSVWAGELKSH